jgi:ubiquinone/menaquinone biosynthesis C-methylase UbiE
LDAGQVEQHCALRIAPNVAHVTATDISGEMVRIARSKVDAEASTNIEFRQAAAEDLVAGRPFDAICAFSVLHLVADVPATLRQMFRQLKPGGLFISKTVCLKDRPVWIQVLVRTMTWLGYAPKVTALSRNGLVRYLNHAGFEILQSTYFGDQHMSPFIVARRPEEAAAMNNPTLPSS